MMAHRGPAGKLFLNSFVLKRFLRDFRRIGLLHYRALEKPLCRHFTHPGAPLTCFQTRPCIWPRNKKTSLNISGRLPEFQTGIVAPVTAARQYCMACRQRNAKTNKCGWRENSFPGTPLSVISRTVVTEKTLAAEKLGSVVSMATKKRVARKKAQEKEIIADHKNMAAYAVGNELYIDRLEKALAEQNLYEIVKLPVDITDTLMATAKYRVDGKAREIYFFEDGSVVCWNMPASERLEVVKFAQKYCENPHEIQIILDESELMNVVTDSFTTLKGNTVHIRAEDATKPENHNTILLEKFAFSNAVAQSVTLSMKEVSLDAFVESIEPKTQILSFMRKRGSDLNTTATHLQLCGLGQWHTHLVQGHTLPLFGRDIYQDLRDGKDVYMTRRALNKKLGEIFLLRHDINLRSDFLDTPDVYWEREELEILYKSMCTYLNIPKRTKVINEKLNYCTQILDLFSSQMNDERHVRLEWFIIALILVEVVFETLHYVERYLDRRHIEERFIHEESVLSDEPVGSVTSENKTS